MSTVSVSNYSYAILGALQTNSTALGNMRHIYGGTVPYVEVQRRRAKNRVAKRSRAINRKRS